jgi:hypothetical protein
MRPTAACITRYQGSVRSRRPSPCLSAWIQKFVENWRAIESSHPSFYHIKNTYLLSGEWLKLLGVTNFKYFFGLVRSQLNPGQHEFLIPSQTRSIYRLSNYYLECIVVCCCNSSRTTPKKTKMGSHSIDSQEDLSSSIAQIDIRKVSLDRQNSSTSTVVQAMTPADTLETNAISPRAYQLEMLEESVKGNIIVAV